MNKFAALLVLVFALPGWIIGFPVSLFIMGILGGWSDADKLSNQARNL